MGCTVGFEVVTLDDAGVTFADRRAGNVDFLADLEHVDADDTADLEAGNLLGGHAEFLHYRTRFNGGFGVMTRGRLVDAACAALAVGNLHRGITVSFGRLDLCHAVVRHVDDRHRDGIPFVGEDARHADLAAD